MTTGITEPNPVAPAATPQAPADEAPAPRTSTGLPARRPGATRITELTGAGPAPAGPARAGKPAAPAAPTAAGSIDGTRGRGGTAPSSRLPRARAPPPACPCASPWPPGSPSTPARRPPVRRRQPRLRPSRASADGCAGPPARPTSSPGPQRKDAAAAEAEEAEHRMPANLTAWLDHRAKLAAARAEAEGKAAAGEDTEAAPTSAPQESGCTAVGRTRGVATQAEAPAVDRAAPAHSRLRRRSRVSAPQLRPWPRLTRRPRRSTPLASSSALPRSPRRRGSPGGRPGRAGADTGERPAAPAARRVGHPAQ